MNKYVKEYLHRGLMFGGFGPIIAGIVYFIIDINVGGISITGKEVLLAIASTYVLAFVQAGASVFNQIEHWGILKSLLFHFISIYLAYLGCYAVNSWITLKPMVIIIFTAIFMITYAVIWVTVYLTVRSTGKGLNQRLK